MIEEFHPVKFQRVRCILFYITLLALVHIKAVEIYEDQSGAVHFIAPNNDCGVGDFDMDRFQVSQHFCFLLSVNQTSLSLDGKLIVIVGDNTDGLVVDSLREECHHIIIWALGVLICIISVASSKFLVFSFGTRNQNTNEAYISH